MMKRLTTIRPLPEVIDPGDPYKVFPGKAARVSKKERVMVVPFGNALGDEFVRLHEMAHTKWSPRNVKIPKGADPRAIQSCEDYRMHKLLRQKAGIDTAGYTYLGNDEFEMIIARCMYSRLEAACTLMSMIGTGEEYRTRNALKPMKIEGAVTFVEREFVKIRKNPYWKDTERAAILLTELCGDEGDTTVDEAAKDPWLDEVESVIPGDSVVRDPARKAKTAHNESGKMKEIKLPMTQRLSARMLGFKNRPTECGSVPIAIHRWCTDKAVFRRITKAKGGGAVLIDLSGSMHLNYEDVMEVLKIMPAAIIAGYSGRSDLGTLYTIAENGRVASNRELKKMLERRAMGNVIDVPALKWLGDQRGPRYWICDGVVTGKEDRSAMNISEQCKKLVYTCKITRVPNVSDLKRMPSMV